MGEGLVGRAYTTGSPEHGHLDFLGLLCHGLCRKTWPEAGV